MKKSLSILIASLFIYATANATHNRAGEITFKHISCNTYGITVTTYTNTLNTQADRCEILINFGDGTSANAPRINGHSSLCPNDSDGVMLADYPNTKLNIYYIEHTYAGPGTYQITMDDPMRNAGTCNIPNSVNTTFSLISELVINPFLGYDDSPVFSTFPLDNADVGVCFYHSPGVSDVNGDSLYFSLDTCYASGVHISGYTFPPNMTNASINPLKGDINWCNPTMVCQYSIAIKVKEYRWYPRNQTWNYMGSVLRDMQITVGSSLNNPPQIAAFIDTTIMAGTMLQLNISATDVENDIVTLSATGEPFVMTPTATFTSTPSINVSGVFSWTPDCTEAQEQPYLISFKAKDSDPSSPLVDYKTIAIHVASPNNGIVGHVNYSGGAVDFGNAVLYKYLPYLTLFDTAQVVAINTSGNYHFTNVHQGQYLIKIFADNTLYPTLIPTYSGNQFLWGSATIANHNCSVNDTMNITMFEKTGTGNGSISGAVHEGVGFLSQPGNAIPDVDMKLVHFPSGQVASSTPTNSSGHYAFNTVDTGSYKIYADIPGLMLAVSNSATITISNTSFTNLNNIVDCVSAGITGDLGVSNISEADNNVIIAPNPFSTQTTLTFNEEQKHTTITITDVLGKEIKIINFSGKQCIIEKGEMSKGIYFVQITSIGSGIGNVINKKIIIQ